ncbi:MAG: carboxypeptidase-like regulatory domain-containing protein [Gemmatimonadales bacterium]
MGSIPIRSMETDTPETVGKIRLIVLTVWPLLTVPHLVAAQAVSGRVVDPLDSPIAGAKIVVNGIVAATSDGDGRFTASGLEWGTSVLEIQRDGYESLSADIWLDETEPSLELVVTLLGFGALGDAEVVSEDGRTRILFGDLRDFYRRVRAASGHYVVRSEVLAGGYRNVSALIDAAFPGLTPREDHDRTRVYRGSFSELQPGCSVPVFVDGLPLPDVFLDDFIEPDQIEGVEYYDPGSIPAEFSELDNSCGLLMIWLRG